MQGLAELDAGRRVLLEWPAAATRSELVIEVAVLDAIRQPRHRAHRRRRCGCSAAMLVPRGREAEWVFASEGGQWQLLASAGVSRLILLSRRQGESQEPVDDEVLKVELLPLATALAPRACFAYGPPILPFLSYDDGVAWRRVVDRAVSPSTGSMLVEDVRLEQQDASLRRRLVFKATPNLIQTEVALHGEDGPVKHDELVHVYLAPLVAGLSLVAGALARWTAPGRRAEVICIGTGGGALPMFLSRQLDEVVHIQAVDLDEVVIGLGKKHFGLGESNNLEVRVEDGLATVARIAQRVQEQQKQADEPSDSDKETCKLEADGLAGVQEPQQVGDGGVLDARVHVIIVDVTSVNARAELSSPPSVFVGTEFLAAARTALHEDGMLAMNVMPSTGGVHEAVLDSLAAVFQQVFQIQVYGGDNFAVFALPASRVMQEPAKEDEAALRRRRWQVNSVVDARLVAQISRVRG